MSNLVVIAYDDEVKAAEAMATLQRLQKQYLIGLDDVAYVTMGQNGKPRLHQSQPLVGAGAAAGSFWGLLIGMLFLTPLFGLAVGAASGALAGKLSDLGIDDEMMKSLARSLQPGTSALFVLFRDVNAEKVLPEMQRFGGKLIKTSLPDDAEKRLRDSLSEGGKAPEMVVAEAQMGAQRMAEGQQQPPGLH